MNGLTGWDTELLVSIIISIGVLTNVTNERTDGRTDGRTGWGTELLAAANNKSTTAYTEWFGLVRARNLCSLSTAFQTGRS